MKTLAKLRRGVYPQPVYEAHFSDGTSARLTFWSEKNKSFDADRGRGLFSLFNAFSDKPIIRGVVEHQSCGKIWRNVDPHFLPHVVETKPKRITAKMTRETLADLLDWLDGDGPDDALERARSLIAA